MESLPKKLVEYLKAGGQLSYDAGGCECCKVTLKPYDELEIAAIWLDASVDSNDAYLEIPAVSLLKDCEGYDPDFILMWLPNEKVFGSWDCDHWKIRVFPGVEWTHMLLNPKKFLNAQWFDYEEEYSVDWYPSGGYEKKAGRPF